MPISAILILLIIAFGFYKLQKNKTLFRRKRVTLSNNKVVWLLGGYVAILLISIGLYSLIPSMRYPIVKDAYGYDYNEIYHSAMIGKINNIDPTVIDEKFKKNYQNKQLTLTFQNLTIENGDSIDVVVERKATNDNEIYGVLFRSKTIVDGVDISKKIKPSHIDLSGDTLTIVEPNQTKINFALSGGELTMKQFTARNWTTHSYMSFGQQLLYLRVPNDLDIVNKAEPTITVHYIGYGK